jgi:hypothetical protein
MCGYLAERFSIVVVVFKLTGLLVPWLSDSRDQQSALNGPPHESANLGIFRPLFGQDIAGSLQSGVGIRHLAFLGNKRLQYFLPAAARVLLTCQ